MTQPNTIEGAPCVKAARSAKLDASSLAELATIVGSVFDVPETCLLNRNRKQRVCFARFSLIWICVSKIGLQRTADLMGWKYRSISHATGRCRDLCIYEAGYADKHHRAIQEAINAGLR